MNQYSQSDYNAILARFYGFYDGVIRSLHLNYHGDGTRSVALDVASRDAQQTENDGWVCVRISMHRITEFGLNERPNSTIQVLSQGIHVHVFGEEVGVEFGGAVDPVSPSDFRSSDAYVFGKVVEFDVGPYF